MSKDGIERTNVRIVLRFTSEEIDIIKRLAERDGADWRGWIESHAALGVEGDMDEGKYELGLRN